MARTSNATQPQGRCARMTECLHRHRHVAGLTTIASAIAAIGILALIGHFHPGGALGKMGSALTLKGGIAMTAVGASITLLFLFCVCNNERIRGRSEPRCTLDELMLGGRPSGDSTATKLL